MTSTEAASEEPDKFAPLFELTASERDVLFNEKNVRLGAMLISSDRGRFEKLLDVLKGNGVGRLRQWEQECRKQLKAAEKRAAKKAVATPTKSGRPVIDYRAPLDTARLFLEQHHPNLIQFHGDWLDHDGSAYTELEDRSVRQHLQRFLETSVTLDPQDGSLTPVKVSGQLVASVMEVMANEVHVARNAYSPPCWLEPQGAEDPPAREVLAFPNGLLHIPSGKMIAATPRFFTFSALPFAYEPDAPEPTRWLQCLEEWWPDSPESRECLQEIFGYLILPDTSLQKIFLLIGASRGGKGTVSRVLTHLIGAGNHVSPTLDQLSQPFGMQAMIGKQLATLTDLYVHRANKASIAVENLLRVSGEDDVTVQRKHKTDWIGRLSVRFLLAGTVAPVLPDMSGSLACRSQQIRAPAHEADLRRSRRPPFVRG